MSEEREEEVEEIEAEAVESETPEEGAVEEAGADEETGSEPVPDASLESAEDEIKDIEEFDEDDEEDEEEDEPETEDVEYNTPADKLFFRTLPRNAARRQSKLRQHLVTPIEFRVRDPHSVYSLDWSKEEIVISSEPNESASCSIELSEKHLFEIVDGQLNPQVAMLSEKIGIKGDMGIAMYAFNLFVRRGRRK